MTERRPTRRPVHCTTDYVQRFLDECAGKTDGRRTVRQTAIICLKFFGPLDAALKTPEALRALDAEFGSELSSASWLKKTLAELDVHPFTPL